MGRGSTLCPMRRQAMTVLAAALLGVTALVCSGCGGDDGSTTTTTAVPVPKLTTAECRRLTSLPVTFTDAVTGLASDLDETVAVLRKFARSSATPDQFRSDFVVLSAASTKIATSLKGVDLNSNEGPSPATIAKLRKLARELDTAKVTESSTSISLWARENCPPSG
jgi:hypothetical protein